MPRSEIKKAKERANYEDRKHRLSASKVMHELQEKFGAEYCLCCNADLPKTHFLWKKEQTTPRKPKKIKEDNSWTKCKNNKFENHRTFCSENCPILDGSL